MYINSGYLNNSRLPFKDKSKPLIVGSCGTYRLRTKERLPTWRPRGRLDYQLLYVASGKTVFYFNGEPKEVAAGHMILFHPRQEQHYEYFAQKVLFQFPILLQLIHLPLSWLQPLTSF